MSSQLNGLFIAYGVTAVTMLVGLLIMRADSRAYWRWPVYSAMVMVLGVVLWSMLRKHVFPPEWAVTRVTLLFYCALTLYAVLGLTLGLLLGRLTAKKAQQRPETSAE